MISNIPTEANKPKRIETEELERLQREAIESDRRIYRELMRPYIVGTLIAGSAIILTGAAAYYVATNLSR
jgi:hypothetical protein